MLYIVNTGFSFQVYKNGKPIPNTERVTWEEANQIRLEITSKKGEM